jgi:hypothetical protein
MDDGSCFCFERDPSGEGCDFVDDYNKVSGADFKPADRRDLCVLQLPTLQLNDPLDSLSHFVMGMWKRFRNDSYSIQKYGQSKVSDAKLSQGYEALYKFALKSAFIRFCDMETPEYVKDNGRLVLQITNFNTGATHFIERCFDNTEYPFVLYEGPKLTIGCPITDDVFQTNLVFGVFYDPRYIKPEGGFSILDLYKPLSNKELNGSVDMLHTLINQLEEEKDNDCEAMVEKLILMLVSSGEKSKDV